MDFRLMGMAASACSLTLLAAFDSSPSYSQNLISEIEFRKNDLPVVVGGRGLPMTVQNRTDTEIDIVFTAPDGFLICDVQFQLGVAIMPAQGTEPFWGGTLQSQTTLRSHQVNGTGPLKSVHDKPSGRVTVQLIPDSASLERCRRPVTAVWYCSGAAGNACSLR
jgi:hypothetical protein